MNMMLFEYSKRSLNCLTEEEQETIDGMLGNVGDVIKQMTSEETVLIIDKAPE